MKTLHASSRARWRTWLAAHHASDSEVWLIFHKRASRRATLAYEEAVDEALCFGWIDGVRRSLDGARWYIRFTPRKAKSIWSNVNVKRVDALKKEGRMTEAGLAAFAKADPKRSGIYALERETARLGPAHQKRFKADAKAWAFFRAQPPGYQRLASFYVVGAKQEETRLRRLDVLIAHCAAGRRLGMLSPPSKRPKRKS